MSQEKLTTDLRRILSQNAGNKDIEVIIELEGEPEKAYVNAFASRSEAVARRKESFLHKAQPIEQLIRELGGDVLGSVWINQTVKARLNASHLEGLSHHQAVASIDIPHQMGRESL